MGTGREGRVERKRNRGSQRGKGEKQRARKEGTGEMEM
jgi:hypothetical protein